MPAVVAREPAVVHPPDTVRVEAPGLVCEVAFDEALPAVEGQRVLVQRTRNEPGDFSDWHVHPNYTTYGYQLSGRLRVDYGPGGAESVECGAGDFVRIPASCVQREGALGDSTRRGIGIRIGSGPPVVDVEGPDARMPDRGAQANGPFGAFVATGGAPVVVREADLDQLESRGLLREVAFEEELPPVDGQRVLVERVSQEPGTASRWRQHPQSVRYAYQVSGRVRIEFGPRGDDSVEAGPGDFLRIPAGTVYREVAVGDESRVGVSIRIGSGVHVVDHEGPA